MWWRGGSGIGNYNLTSSSLSYVDSGFRPLNTSGRSIRTTSGGTAQREFLNGTSGGVPNYNSGNTSVFWVSFLAAHESGSSEAILMMQNGSSVDQSPYAGDGRFAPLSGICREPPPPRVLMPHRWPFWSPGMILFTERLTCLSTPNWMPSQRFRSRHLAPAAYFNDSGSHLTVAIPLWSMNSDSE